MQMTFYSRTLVQRMDQTERMVGVRGTAIHTYRQTGSLTLQDRDGSTDMSIYIRTSMLAQNSSDFYGQ